MSSRYLETVHFGLFANCQTAFWAAYMGSVSVHQICESPQDAPRESELIGLLVQDRLARDAKGVEVDSFQDHMLDNACKRFSRTVKIA